MYSQFKLGELKKPYFIYDYCFITWTFKKLARIIWFVTLKAAFKKMERCEKSFIAPLININ